MKPESKTQKRNKIFKWTLFLLFLSFIILYLSQATGYYEYEQSRKTAFTAEQIKQFEQDAKHSSFDKVTLSLLTSRGDVGYGSGINWGIRRNHQELK